MNLFAEFTFKNTIEQRQYKW